MDNNPFDDFDSSFAKFKSEHPGATHSEFAVAQVAASIRGGRRHPTLGKVTLKYDDFWRAGRQDFARYQRVLPFTRNMKVIDYGCGSLRLGAHFIRFLDPGCYFGIDVTTDFIDMGKEAIGEELLREKQPQFGTLCEESLRAAERFEADFVISTACAFQIHPDEKHVFIENMKRLSKKCGCIVCFDTKIADKELRYRSVGYVWTLDYYTQNLAPMLLLESHKIKEHSEYGQAFEGKILIFGKDNEEWVERRKDIDVQVDPKGYQPRPQVSAGAIEASFERLFSEVIHPGLVVTSRRPIILAHTLTGPQRKLAARIGTVLPVVLSNFRELAVPAKARQAASLEIHAAESIDVFFSSGVLDFLQDISGVIASAARVLRQGGHAVFRLKEQRVVGGALPPTVSHHANPVAFGLEPSAVLPSMKVGRGWLLKTMEAFGFDAANYKLVGEAGEDSVEWFVGRKVENIGTNATAKSMASEALDDSMLDQPGRRYALYFRLPSTNLVYYRNVRSGLSSTLEAIDKLAVAAGIYKHSLATKLSEVRKLFRVKPEDIPSDALTYTIVRNPYRRLAAVYNYGIVTGAFLHDAKGAIQYKRFGFTSNTDFSHFVRGIVTIKTNLADDYVAPQSHLLFDGGMKRVRYVANLESISDDWALLMRLNGLDISLPHRNASRRRVIWTEELRELAYAYYRDDFRIFGYAHDSVPVEGAHAAIAPVSVAAVNFEDAYVEECARQVKEDNAAVRELARCAAGGVAVDGSAEPAQFIVAAPAAEREYFVPLPPSTGCKRAIVRISAPPVPPALRRTDFAEHVLGPDGEPTDQVIVCGKGVIGVSADLGDTWQVITHQCATDLVLRNCFTRADGGHIVQSKGWQGPKGGSPSQDRHGVLLVFNKDWRLEGCVKGNIAHWHGTASIGQSGKTIMFAEYQNNGERYLPGFDVSRASDLQQLRPNAVLRSRDGGLNWTKVFEKGPQVMRHFHTVQPDPFAPGRWWLSSGDLGHETYVWRSDDDGDTWVEVSNPDPDIAVAPSYAKARRACQRYTDIVIGEDYLFWGADDYMGALKDMDQHLPLRERAGSRLYVSPKDGTLQPQEVGYIGLPVRSLVDVGPGWVVITEAKDKEVGLHPAVFMVFKRDYQVVKLFEAENHMDHYTGFTHSRASRKAKRGTFFSYRASSDVFPVSSQYPRLLKWHIEFE